MPKWFNNLSGKTKRNKEKEQKLMMNAYLEGQKAIRLSEERQIAIVAIPKLKDLILKKKVQKNTTRNNEIIQLKKASAILLSPTYKEDMKFYINQKSQHSQLSMGNYDYPSPEDKFSKKSDDEILKLIEDFERKNKNINNGVTGGKRKFKKTLKKRK